MLSQEAIDGAAKEGHLEVVVWLHRNTTAGATKAAMVRFVLHVLFQSLIFESPGG